MPHKSRTESLKERLTQRILSRLPHEGRLETAIPGLALTRMDHETEPEQCLNYPMAAVVAQGAKHAFYGELEASYGPMEYLVLGMDMPGIYQITRATPEEPFLALSLRLDFSLIADLLDKLPAEPKARRGTLAPVGVASMPLALLDAFCRLLGLLDLPERAPIFIPLLMREIHFLLLCGENGQRLRMFCARGSRRGQIAQSIDWLRAHFAEPLKMEELARLVNMASSTFNRSFREATSLSPLQFQKKLRLHEAQRLMLMEGQSSRDAAMNVGYESASQFTREYKRLFGLPPGMDIKHRRPR